jgi:competence ComEA-like helix-hairpin-helix protein
MSRPNDWTPGPAKWIVVLILGGATVAGLGYSMARGMTPWRAMPSARAMASVPSAAGTADREEPSPAPAPANPPKPAAIAAKININTAGKPELELLPGVGPALAERIIAERTKGGAFKRVEDLGRVRGIGPKTIEQLRGHVVVE